MGRILVGTTAWTEKTLIESGRFYPPGCKSAEERLRFYASRFPIVEVDSSYYALPSERNAELWRERTPEGFVFDVKAFRLFTLHQTPPRALPPDVRETLPRTGRSTVYYDDLEPEVKDDLWERFRGALRPLGEGGRLGAVLFQFPPWFVLRQSSLDHILECRRRMPGFRIAVELRNKSWFGDGAGRRTLDFERERDLAHVVADEPQGFPSSIPAVWEATSPALAIVRLHGRNRATWTKKGLATAAERFDYLYSKEELEQLVEPIRRLAERVEETHVLFNNCYRDHAQRNAAEFMAMIEGS